MARRKSHGCFLPISGTTDSVKIDKLLVNKRRLSESGLLAPLITYKITKFKFPSGIKLIPILIYLPLGLILATIRVFIGIQALVAATLLYKLSSVHSVVLRFMCAILGIIVIKENENVEDESVKVIVSNHVSLLDHLVIHLLHNSFSMKSCALPAFLHQGLNYKNMGVHQNQELFIKNVKSFLSNGVTIDIQPEAGITSGKKGLLKFSLWPCKLSCPIQPVAIKIWRPPIVDISVSVINTSWISDLFWFFFVPFTVFKVQYLSVVKQIEDESPEEMSKRIEKLIADELKISTTNFTINDKIELEKRLDREMNVIKQPPSRISIDPSLVEMASKVKDILPDVPLTVIYKDLAKTKNIDVTIANFLEGVINYIPEKISPPPQDPLNIVSERRKSSLNAGQPSTSFDTSSKTFYKSAEERMISFQERKLRLIQSARQRYIEKHALNVMNCS